MTSNVIQFSLSPYLNRVHFSEKPLLNLVAKNCWSCWQAASAYNLFNHLISIWNVKRRAKLCSK